MHADFVIPVTLFVVIAYIVKVVSDNRMRRLLVEKGEINENLKYLFADRLSHAVPSSLKWGMVLIAVGLAFLFSQVLDLGWHDETALFAMIFIFGGAALVIYYFIASRMLKKAGNQQ
ncbi:hypothetical protein EH223_08240 [candidate division KSB1 bacterium]|nr:hypothetical protein [candidate division KSB1 bacterium]RQW04180.1 MAG: hypothetical protein EH223_08240 [candidate division KSB1 bacterium]